MKEAPVRRIVTGHDPSGKAIIQEDGWVPRVKRIGGEHGPLFFEVWNTRGTPAPIDFDSSEPAEEGIQLAPPARGTRIRVLDIPPEDASIAGISREAAQAHFAVVEHDGLAGRHRPLRRRELHLDLRVEHPGQRAGCVGLAIARLGAVRRRC